MATIHHQFAIRAGVEQVYAALATAEGVSSWWDQQTSVETPEGLVWEHNPGPKHGVVRLKVLQRERNQRVEWECISTHAQESPAHAWTGTHFLFELSQAESPAATTERECAAGEEAKDLRITTVDFRQTHYDSESPYFGFNNFAWASALTQLKQVCESPSA